MKKILVFIIFVLFLVCNVSVNVSANSILDSELNVEKGNLLNYLVVEKPVLKTPGEQKIVLSFGDNEKIDEISILVSNNRDEHEYELIKNINNIYEFSHKYENGESGEYTVSKIKYKLNNKEYEILLKDIEIDARFGVNKEYNGIGQAEGVVLNSDGEFITNSQQSETNGESSIISLGVDSLYETTKTLEEGINANNPSTYQNNGLTIAQNNPLIIALDPGHGGSEPGMTAVNGVSEKVFNLSIAKYLKTELSKYVNVKVVMTRDGDYYVGLEERCEIAKQKNASYLISMHLNALNKKTSGAEVYYPHANYNSAISEKGKQLAQKVLDELVLLGIENRGIKIKYPFDDYTGEPMYDPKYDYPDGSYGDYYAVIRYSKLRNITGLLVEHCYADNKDDFEKYLNSEEKLKNLAIADAKGIVKAFGLVTAEEFKEGWRLQSDSFYYYDKNGEMLKSQWIGNYYVGSDGAWIPNKPTSDWEWTSEGWKYKDYTNNTYATSTWKQINGKWYYLNDKSVMVTGFYNVGNNTYYFAKDGKMLTGWQVIDGNHYYFNNGGVMIKSRWVGNYYLEETGIMATNKWIGHSYVGSDGAWIPNYKG